MWFVGGGWGEVGRVRAQLTQPGTFSTNSSLPSSSRRLAGLTFVSRKLAPSQLPPARAAPADSRCRCRPWAGSPGGQWCAPNQVLSPHSLPHTRVETPNSRRDLENLMQPFFSHFVFFFFSSCPDLANWLRNHTSVNATSQG